MAQAEIAPSLPSARTRISVGAVILGGLMLLGVIVAFIRYANGIGAISNLNDAYPWGMWISFDLLCGVALAAGAFTMAAIVHIFRIEKYHKLCRPAILTGFLGYLMVVLALMVDLGRPERIWHLIIYWNPRSVMFEVGWCVMLYTIVLALEFSPDLFKRFGWQGPVRLLQTISVALVIVGVVLSTLHQSSLGSLFLIMPDKLHPLWYTPLLPLFFFISAVAVGPAMVIAESYFGSKTLNQKLESDVLASLSKVLPYILGLYLILKIGDLAVSGKLGLLFASNVYALLFWLELVIGVILPMILLAMAAVRESRTGLLVSALLVIGGLMLNRFSVSLTALARPEGATYFPHWMEFVISLAIWSAGIAAYWLIMRYVILYEPEEQPA
jgi:Ni/Fe-hydrogenase subunit HybB-like protein